MNQETGRQIFDQISRLRLEDANEASTRFHVIDRVITELLGWTKPDISVEERTSEDGTQEFIDFALSVGQFSMVIEAKRIGKSFGRLPTSRKVFVKGQVSTGVTKDAVLQARDYARQKGSGFAIATNGLSWIIFPVNRRDGVSFDNSLCLVFPDARSYLIDDLQEFVSLLSRDAVLNGSLDKELLGFSADQTDIRRLNQIYDRTFSKMNRASIFSMIESQIITAFSEELSSDDQKLLETLYVETPARIRFDARINMYIRQRDSVLRTSPIKGTTSSGKDIVQRRIVQTRIEPRKMALVAIGLVGSGKTTFLRYIRQISLADFFAIRSEAQTAYWIYVDFRDFAPSESPRDFIVNLCMAAIITHPYLSDYQKCIQYAYQSEIDALRRGPLAAIAGSPEDANRAIADYLLKQYSEKAPYVTRILSYVARSKPIFLVIDNVDQIEESDAQERIFQDALALSRTFNTNLVLAMRDVTYVRNRGSAIFDAYDFDAIYIDPPDVKSVLSKRFDVASNLLKGSKIEFVSEGGSKILVSDGSSIIEMLRMSVLGTEVSRFIEVAATGDTRLALQMTRQFLQYGYTSTQKAFEKFQRTGKYVMPPHEAIRAIILGNQSIYREEYSAVGNPFDSKMEKNSLQFLRLYAMAAIVRYAGEPTFNGLSVANISAELEKIGVSRAQSRKMLTDLAKLRFVFSRSHQEINDESMLIPSRFGGYVVRELIARFVFLETMLFDTFIYDNSVFSAIKKNMEIIYRERDLIRKLRIRKEIASVFYDFCEEGVEVLAKLARERGLPDQWCHNPMTGLKYEFRAELERALRSAQRNYSTDDPALPLFMIDRRGVTDTDHGR